MPRDGAHPGASLKTRRKASQYERRMALAWCWIVGHGLVPASWPGTPKLGATTLEVTGKRSGLLRRIPVTWVEVEGARYLVAMLGEESDWVHNVRAAGGRAALRRGSRRQVLLEELPVAERAPVLRAWYSRAGKSSTPRKYIALDPGARLPAFEEIAPRLPVFRIRSAEDVRAK